MPASHTHLKLCSITLSIVLIKESGVKDRATSSINCAAFSTKVFLSSSSRLTPHGGINVPVPLGMIRQMCLLPQQRTILNAKCDWLVHLIHWYTQFYVNIHTMSSESSTEFLTHQNLNNFFKLLQLDKHYKKADEGGIQLAILTTSERDLWRGLGIW